MKKIKKENKLACPFCGKILTEEDFGGGKWMCRNKKCGKFFNYSLWKMFCDQEEKWNVA